MKVMNNEIITTAESLELEVFESRKSIQFPTSTNKKDLDVWVKEAKEMLLSGFLNPLDIAIKQKALSYAFEELFKSDEIKSMIKKEAAKYAEKTIVFGGAKITKSNRKTYDFSNCNHFEYFEKIKEFKKLELEIKNFETLLKSLKEQVANVETGEIINPPTFTELEIISISL